MTAGNTSFPKTARITQADDFRDIVKQSPYAKESGVVIYYRKCDQSIFGKLGIIVAKRHLKRAVDRNRFKRVIREVYRKNKARIQKNLEIVVRLSDYKALHGKDLAIIIDHLFQKARVYRDESNFN